MVLLSLTRLLYKLFISTAVDSGQLGKIPLKSRILVVRLLDDCVKLIQDLDQKFEGHYKLMGFMSLILDSC